MGWIKTLEVAPSHLPADRWPWSWTYALFLEKRWEQIREISSAYGDDEAVGDNKEIPKEYWHDHMRVDEWIERMKDKRKAKNEEQMR